MRSVQCCTSDRCLSQCECECVSSGGWVVVVGGGQSSVLRGVREGRGARTGGSSAS